MADDARVDEQGNRWIKVHNSKIDSGTIEVREDYFEESLKDQDWKKGEAKSRTPVGAGAAGGEA